VVVYDRCTYEGHSEMIWTGAAVSGNDSYKVAELSSDSVVLVQHSTIKWP
jgi:hypothetical protein